MDAGGLRDPAETRKGMDVTILHRVIAAQELKRRGRSVVPLGFKVGLAQSSPGFGLC
jgi:hypothetical protein